MAETCRLCYVTLCVSGDDQTGCVEKDMELNFTVAPCISNIKQFIVQLMHTNDKILRLLK